MITIEEVRQRYENHVYEPRPWPVQPDLPKDGILDEEKSVRWNREEIIRLTGNYQKLLKEWRQHCAEMSANLRIDLGLAIRAEYNLNERQTQILEGFIWEKYHSSVHDYINAAYAYGTLAVDLTLASKVS